MSTSLATAASAVAEIRPQVGGIIEKRVFEEGSRVNAGDVLYRIDARPYQAALDAAKAAALASTECWHLTAAALYLHTPDGLGRSKLAERLPRLLNTPTTARNWNTVQALATLAAT